MRIHLAAVVMLATALTTPLGAQMLRDYSVNRQVARAQPPLRASLEFGAGRVLLRGGSRSVLYDARFRYDADRFTPVHQYDQRTGALHLGLESVGRVGLRVTNRAQLEQVARFEFSPDVPLELEASLGASDAVLELGGLTLASLVVRSGATRGTIDVAEPTLGSCREAVFVVGAAELLAMQFANAGCRTIRVEGGIGRALLDLSGTWRTDVHIEASLAMGALTLRVPRGVGVQVTAERFLTRLSIDGLQREGDAWRTARYDSAEHKITLALSANIADVDIEWID